MAWSKLLPNGDLSIAVGDDAIRANNTQLELALDLEHQFATGGLQTGRHKFAALNVGGQGGLVTAAADDGWVIMRTDVRTGMRCWFVYDAAAVAWVPVDVGTADVPRLDEQSEFTVSQWGEWHLITLIGAVCPIDFAESAFQHAVHPGSSTLTVELAAVPNIVSGFGCSATLKFVNAGGASLLAWEPIVFVFAQGIPLFHDPAVNAVNVYNLTVLDDERVLVTGVSGAAP